MNYTTADYLESLQNDMARINEALGLPEGSTFTDVATMSESGEITTGEGGGGADDYTNYFAATIEAGTTSVPGYATAISKFPALQNIGTSCAYMFYYFQGDEIDLSSFDTTNVTNMEAMFRGCTNIGNLDVSTFNTANVTNMKDMFRGCENYLTTLDLSNFDTSNVTNMDSMFIYDWNLLLIDMRNFTFDSVTQYGNMFTGVPGTCEIVVKSQTEKDWMATNFPEMENVKTVAEYEAQ